MAWRELIRVGTSGWHYAHWKESFYPAVVAPEDYLGYYNRFFDTVEINNSFYSLPSRGTLESWRSCVSSDFVFSAKASRYLTHMKKLREPEEPLERFLRRMGVLGESLGPILFQLPPHWRLNLERLSAFLELLPPRPCAFEFRDRSWFDPRVYELLQRHGHAVCIYDLDGALSPIVTLADFVYVRLHGPDGPYRGSYDVQTLAGWAGRLSTWAHQGRDVYCYFDNDEAAFAAQNALRLSRMLKGDHDA